jgi:hypothetical protein
MASISRHILAAMRGVAGAGTPLFSISRRHHDAYGRRALMHRGIAISPSARNIADDNQALHRRELLRN